jgi:hypothetical protein
MQDWREDLSDLQFSCVACCLYNFQAHALEQQRTCETSMLIILSYQKVAVAVIKEVIRDNQATKLREKELANLDAFVMSKMYNPVYVPLVEKRELML